MAKTITRRGLVAGLGAVAAAAAAQETAATKPVPAAAASSPSSIDEDLKAARDQARENAAKLASVVVPFATEPAFVFKP
jgi:ABC-type transporter MlaC component